MSTGASTITRTFGLQVKRSTALADARTRAPAKVEVHVGRVSSKPALVRVGLSTGTITMMVLAAVGLGGIVLLVTAKPAYAGLAALGGLFIGSQLGSETGA